VLVYIMFFFSIMRNSQNQKSTQEANSHFWGLAQITGIRSTANKFFYACSLVWNYWHLCALMFVASIFV
jgi:hypothetical protein